MSSSNPERELRKLEFGVRVAVHRRPRVCVWAWLGQWGPRVRVPRERVTRASADRCALAGPADRRAARPATREKRLQLPLQPSQGSHVSDTLSATVLYLRRERGASAVTLSLRAVWVCVCPSCGPWAARAAAVRACGGVTKHRALSQSMGQAHSVWPSCRGSLSCSPRAPAG